jgi:transposase InsO family protein
MLSVMSVVVAGADRFEHTDEKRTDEKDRELVFDLQVINTSETSVAVPHGLVLGQASIVDESSLSSLATAEQVLLDAIAAEEADEKGREGIGTGESLPDYLDARSDREPEREAPPEEEFRRRVSELTHLTETQREQVLAVLLQHRRAFALKPNAPEQAKIPPHRIDLLPGTNSVYTHPYRSNPRKLAEVMRQVREKEEAGLIQPSTSAFAAPVVLAKKQDGSWRFCVDYRQLNKVTVPDKFPLPRIHDLLDRLGGNEFFSCWDLASGFYQIPVAEADREKTAFSTPEGLWEWVRMPMGLTNSPATFQRAMNMVLSGLNWITCLVYVDDVIIFSKTFEEHLQTTKDVLCRLEAHGMSLKLKKCTFFQSEVDYLGHVVSARGRRPHPKNLRALRELPVPSGKKAVTQVQGFLGLCNYYSHYIKDFAIKVEPLVRLTKKGIKFVWTEEQQGVWDALKLDLCSAPLIRFPDFERPFVVQTDACGYGLGAVLVQKFDDGEHPVLFLSRSLSESERKWAARELEALAVVWAVNELRPYLEGGPFTVQTDHESLQWLMRTTTPGRLSRWALALQEFLPHMAIEYRKGLENGNADFFSRFPLSALEVLPEELQDNWLAAAHMVTRMAGVSEGLVALTADMCSLCTMQARPRPQDFVAFAPVQTIPTDPDEEFWAEVEGSAQGVDGGSSGASETLQDGTFLDRVREGYEADPKWKQLLDFLEQREGQAQLTRLEEQQMEYRAQHFSVRDGLLYLRSFLRRNNKEPRRAYERLVIPDWLRGFVIAHLHDPPAGAHLGATRIESMARERFFWPRMNKDVHEFVRTCVDCQFAKAKRQHSAGLLQPKQHNAPGVLSVDIQGPFPRGTGGMEYVLTIKDVFLKQAVLTALSGTEGGTSAKRCCDVLFKRWVCVLGIPRAIITDQGPQFMAELTTRFCARLGIDKRRTAVYHPQSNAQAERQHGFHTPLLKALTGRFPKSWPTKLPFVQFAVLTSPHRGLGISPLEMLTGYPPVLPVELYAEVGEVEVEVDRHKYTLEHPREMKRMHEMLNKVREELDAKSKANYDKTQRDVEYKIEDLCLAFKPVRTKGSQKLQVNFRGPFRIVSKVGSVTYRVVLSRDEKKSEGERKVWPVSVKNMVPFHERTQVAPTTWAEVDEGLPRPSPPPRTSNRRVSSSPGGAAVPDEFAGVGEDEGAALMLRNMTNTSVFFCSTNRGVGTFARRDIAEGTRLTEYTGERLSAEEHKARYDASGVPASYSMVLPSGEVIDSTDFRVSNWSRYVNAPGPSEEANCAFDEGVGEEAGRVFLVTLRPLAQGEELRADYGPGYVWEAGQPLLDAADSSLRVPPPVVDLSHLVWGEAQAGAEAEEGAEKDDLRLEEAQAEEALREAAAEGGEAVGEREGMELPPLEVGDYVLARLEMPPCGLYVVRVTEVDEFRESAEVHICGTYGTWKRGKFARAWMDPKDRKQIFTEKPLHRYMEEVATIWAEHVVSPSFALLKSGRVPTALVRLAEEWEEAAGFVREKKQARK